MAKMKGFVCLRFVLIGLFSVNISGCATIGTQTITRDRFDYNTAISESWKQQTLLNIVKIRYADMPLFVEVASVVSGYTLEGSVNLGGSFPTKTSVGDVVNLGTTGKYVDRPTITYAPITGKEFNLSFMTPIPPTAVLFLMHSGWPANMIFPMTVDAINGKRARVAQGKYIREGDKDFYRIAELLAVLQRAGAIGMKVVRASKAGSTTVMFFHRRNLTDQSKQKLKELSELLEIKLGSQEIRISYGLFPEGDQEIAVLTRSLLQIMIAMARQVEVPEDDVASGRTVPSSLKRSDPNQLGRLIDIRYSDEKPENAFIAVEYRDHWFWIDDRDFDSKRAFTFLMILVSLMETGGDEGLPVVTIPAG